MPEAGDPPNNTDIPSFFKSKLSDVDREVAGEKGRVEVIAESPGGLPVYEVTYGKKDDLHSQANYNSAIGAGNAAYFAEKTPDTKPVVFFLGPVHGAGAGRYRRSCESSTVKGKVKTDSKEN